MAVLHHELNGLSRVRLSKNTSAQPRAAKVRLNSVDADHQLQQEDRQDRGT